MKSLINLCAALLDDSRSICPVETDRDMKTIISRSQHEGISFFTITLPEFASEFERALEAGQVDSTCFPGWKKHGCLPAFLQGFTSLVFGINGRIKDEPLEKAVFCIRQICRFFKKVRLSCTYMRERRAFKNYQQIETAFRDTTGPRVAELDHFYEVATAIWSQVFPSEFNTFGVVPRHGPGATAEGVSGNAKYKHLYWNERLDAVFPVTEHYFTSVNHMLSHEHGLDNLVMRSASEELPVRVISVPKTLKAPRIIAIEPVCMQYTQQAVGRWIMKMIQSNVLTKNSIRFNDQSVNQQMALRASLDKSLATIDLSDASDRVPLSMVRFMLDCCPTLLEAIEACRSRSAKLPEGEIIQLRKFASMGSALCFPIESMYFYTIIVHAILWRHNLPPSRRNLIEISSRVYIYGDDIIIPVGETDTVVEALTNFGCKVNSTKSFWNGSFRESCGTDAFRGIDVTPIYLREMCPRNRRNASGLLSWIATSNLLFKAGLWRTSDYMKKQVESVLGPLPVVLETSPGLGWYSFQGIPSNSRMCKHLHTPIVRTYRVQTKKEKDILDGYPALLKYFLTSQHENEAMGPRKMDKEHLRRSARLGTVSRKRQWVPAL